MTPITEPYQTSVNHAPAANTQATISSEAPNASDFVIVNSICATLTAVATPPAGELQVVLRDGAAGAGAIKWTGFLMVAANGHNHLIANDLWLPMSVGNVATLEFTAAGGATTRESVTLGYTVSNRLG